MFMRCRCLERGYNSEVKTDPGRIEATVARIRSLRDRDIGRIFSVDNFVSNRIGLRFEIRLMRVTDSSFEV